jgi:Inner membrane component of T3SS, cytoplasmic domain
MAVLKSNGMQVHCPRCGSRIHLDDSPDAPRIVRCWMCRSIIEHTPADPGPPTVLVSSPVPRDRPGPIGLSETSFPEAANLNLPAGTHVKISVVEGPSQGREFEITRSITTIGRIGGGADIEIDDPGVSRSHCAIEVRRDQILLYDLRSTNGTFLGNSNVSVAGLEPRAIFRIGTSQLQLKTT